MRMPADCCVCNNISSFTPFEMHGLRITFAKYFFSVFRLPHFSSLSVHIKCTSNMAAGFCAVLS